MNEREQALAETRTNIKDKAFRTIFVKFQKEGIHCYPAAATDPALATGDEYDVSFLANPHRNMFHFHVTVQVFNNDRDIEFIQFIRCLENLYAYGTLELNHKSCEMISDDLYDQIAARYPDRSIVINVSEDDENGAAIVYNVLQPYHTIKI